MPPGVQVLVDFADAIFVDRIREALWCGRDFGRATVVIGAGFSRNAVPITASAEKFPLLQQFSELLYEHLYPAPPSPNSAYYNHKVQMTSGHGTLALAMEYEAAFGRAALDSLLAGTIKDNDFAPGPLHQLLLDLPWSDVLTTNYDTLLEKTLPFVDDRKYDVVCTASDMPQAMRPRIIKLHGSFPSHRPFVLTEEDYRKYPSDSVTFVNLVQQIMMENVVCLLGFSGDDQNFLHWAGWVRDNLGRSVPPIYLCGILDLTGPRRHLLESRNVIPIDLGPVFPLKKYPDWDERHSVALEFFLSLLHLGNPPNPFAWPRTEPQRPRPMSDRMKQLILVSPIKEEQPSPKDSLDPTVANSMIRGWTVVRAAYPGWVITPHRNRESLEIYTRLWLEPIIAALAKLPASVDILLLGELVWRLQRCLLPFFSNHVPSVKSVICHYDPFALRAQTAVEIISPTAKQHGDLP